MFLEVNVDEWCEAERFRTVLMQSWPKHTMKSSDIIVRFCIAR